MLSLTDTNGTRAINRHHQGSCQALYINLSRYTRLPIYPQALENATRADVYLPHTHQHLDTGVPDTASRLSFLVSQGAWLTKEDIAWYCTQTTVYATTLMWRPADVSTSNISAVMVCVTD